MLCRAHKEVLYFASPFFEAALSGDWAETARRQSISSVITISRLPSVPEGQRIGEATSEMTFAPLDPDVDPDELDIDDIDPPRSDEDGSDEQVRVNAIAASLEKLEGSPQASNSETLDSSTAVSSEDGPPLAPASQHSAPPPITRYHDKLKKRLRDESPEAVIVLKEERVCCVFLFV